MLRYSKRFALRGGVLATSESLAILCESHVVGKTPRSHRLVSETKKPPHRRLSIGQELSPDH